MLFPLRFCLIFLLFFSYHFAYAKDSFSEIFKFSSLKNEYENNSRRVNYKPLKIAFFSNINLYSKPEPNSVLNIMPEWSNLPFDKPNFTNEPFFLVLDDQAKEFIFSRLVTEPDLNSSIIYDHSQLLFQESIRELLYSLKDESLDMVIFAGNQVYSSEQYSNFQEIAQDLIKYKVPYYEIIGENELKGTKDLSRILKDRFFMLKTKNTNIIILDNLNAPVIPESIPYEATDQYLWLESILKNLSENEPNSHLILISYNKLETKLIEKVINHKLNLVSALHSSSLDFNIERGDFLSVDLPSLSSYPCSYGLLIRDNYGNYSFELKKVAIQDIQELAKKRVKDER